LTPVKSKGKIDFVTPKLNSALITDLEPPKDELIAKKPRDTHFIKAQQIPWKREEELDEVYEQTTSGLKSPRDQALPA